MDETLQNLKVPNFILQPLVENCIMHGIDPRTASGKIIIRNFRKSNDLFFEVEDNGCGISKEKQEEIFSAIKENKGFSGVGLKSIHNRLQSNFGSSYGISGEL